LAAEPGGYSSWTARRRELVKTDPDDGRRQIQQIAAHVLSNRQPPYSVRGASAVAFATLLKAARSGLLKQDALVLLNITGGGRHRRHRDRRLIPARPALQLDQQEIYLDETSTRIAHLFR